jgi:hypothetical protein
MSFRERWTLDKPMFQSSNVQRTYDKVTFLKFHHFECNICVNVEIKDNIVEKKR